MQPTSKSSTFLALLFTLCFSGCLVPTTSNNTSGSSHQFYAHCISAAQTSVLDVVGDTGTLATSTSAEVDGDASLSENTNLCQSAWAPVKVQPTSNGNNENISFYTSGTSSVIFLMDLTPYNNNPNANSVSTTGVIESGFLYGTTMVCTLYPAHPVIGSTCSPSETNLGSCPNLNWNICSN